MDMNEPWEIVEHSWSETGIYAGEQRIALLAITGATEENEQQLASEMLEYARRIVAAVNACAGVPIEILEAGKMVPPDISYRDLKQQRNELLAALKKCCSVLGGNTMSKSALIGALESGLAAIAKAEGKGDE